MFLNLNLLLPTLPAFICWVQNTKLYNRTFKFTISIFALLTQLAPVSAQTVTNGSFDNQASGWGCSPEATHKESTYGGSSSTNRVAEVDQQAGLCQTITGFTIGSEYSLSFKCSRRTTCGPTLQTMDVTISGAVLSEAVSRNGGGFNFTTETFTFVASATSHTLKFEGTVSGTCGLIVDDIEVQFVSALPVDLVHFDAEVNENKAVTLTWATAMELNNDYFTIERSVNGTDWDIVNEITGAGNSDNLLEYKSIDNNPFTGTSYYRLKQTDYNGEYTYSDIRKVGIGSSSIANLKVFPNPARFVITVQTKHRLLKDVSIFNMVGQDVTLLTNVTFMKNEISLNIESLPRGQYKLKVGNAYTTLIKN